MQPITRTVRITDSVARTGQGLQREVFRKSIHMLIALVPSMVLLLGIEPTMALLSCGIITYTYSELQRMRGRPVMFVSHITRMASRDRDFGHFVLGPVSLGLGALLALLLYPYPAAVVAIYALAFGDGISSIVGKLFGRIRIPATGGKTVAGSLACFLAIFLSSMAITSDVRCAAIIAAAGTFLEALPTQDFDNILLPMGVGLLAQILLIV